MKSDSDCQIESELVVFITKIFFAHFAPLREQVLDSTVSEVVRRVTKVKDGDMTDIEATLVAQSITLDGIFNEFATK